MNPPSKPARPSFSARPLAVATDMKVERPQIAGPELLEAKRFENPRQLHGPEYPVATPKGGRQTAHDFSLNALEVRDDQHQAPAGFYHAEVLLNHCSRVVEMLDQTRRIHQGERFRQKRGEKQIFADDRPFKSVERQIRPKQETSAERKVGYQGLIPVLSPEVGKEA